jgi:hypothetical protein
MPPLSCSLIRVVAEISFRIIDCFSHVPLHRSMLHRIAASERIDTEANSLCRHEAVVVVAVQCLKP